MKIHDLVLVSLACMGLLCPVHAAVLKLETPNMQLVLDVTEGQQLAMLYFGDKSATLEDISNQQSAISSQRSAISDQQSAIRVLDVGTGSGCIALALKKKHPEWIVEGLDKSEEAISVAKRNAKKLGLDVRFFVADILSDEIGEYDLIVSNPPYIRPSERGTMTENTLRYEPKEALFVTEEDPLLFYRRIAQLHKAKELWFEISETQGDAMLELMQQTDYEAECLKDMYGKQRFIHAIQK